MRKSVITLLMITASASVYAQNKNKAAFKTETIELISPWVYQGDKATVSMKRYGRSCFNLITLAHWCDSLPGVGVMFGDRMGTNWDLFQILGGKVGQTRMIEIGKFGWNDKFTLPYVEPWAALAPGERRNIHVNVSGANGAAGTPGQVGEDGEDGIAGMNGDGTYTPMPRRDPVETRQKTIATTNKNYATANVKEQVSSTVKGKDGKVRANPYTPYVEAKKGYMYVVHIVAEKHDFYVLIHVDDLERGESVKLSFIKLEFSAL